MLPVILPPNIKSICADKPFLHKKEILRITLTRLSGILKIKEESSVRINLILAPLLPPNFPADSFYQTNYYAQ